MSELTSVPASSSLPAPASPTPAAFRSSASAPRDLTIDALRAIAILAVVVGHWLVVVPSFSGGRFDGVNALASVPLMRVLSWAFQVMPLFFVAGGVANGASWRGSRARGVAYPDWLRGRLLRLARPTIVLVAVWVTLGALLRAAGVDPAFVHTMAWLVVVPVWFLAVYVIVVALAPPMLVAYERFGGWSLLVLAALATAVDAVRLGTSIDGVEWTNFFWVFLFCQQLGYFWLDGRLGRHRWTAWALLIGGIVALYLLTHVGPYPVSMVGVPGERIANNAPPTITLVALGVAQTGLGLLLRARLERSLARPRVAGAALTLNTNAMTILLWHFTALVITALAILPLGVMPSFAAGSGAWWLVRVLTLLLYAGPLVVLVRLFGRVERDASRRPAAMRPRADGDGIGAAVRSGTRPLLAAAALAAAFSMITVGGLSVPTARLGIPIVPLILLAFALILLRTTEPVGVAVAPATDRPTGSVVVANG